MIACYSRNQRAACLFKQLRAIDPEFEDLGIVKASYRSKFLSALVSIRWNWNQMRSDMQFSPVLAAEMEAQGSNLLHSIPATRAILYWGATSFPAKVRDRTMPYFIITDGPFDPGDKSYPVEWRPARWGKSFFIKQHCVYQGAAHVFTLSEWARSKIIATHGLDPSRVTRVGWGPMHFCVEPAFQLDNPEYFLSFGNEWQRKGMDIVAKATQLLRNRHPDLVTIIAGKPFGMSIDSCPGLEIRPAEITPQVAQQLISRSRAVIVASRFDASPHVIYEALQAGTPVIGSNVCGIPEAIHAPVGGRLFRPEDPDALADAMESIIAEDIPTQRKAALEVYENSGGWMRTALIIRQTILKIL